MTSKFNSARYGADFKKAHHRYEVYSYGQFKPALDEQVKPIIEHVKNYGGISSDLAAMMVKKLPIEQAYKNVYINIGVLHAKWTLNQINKIAKKNFFSEKWAKLMELFFTNESADRVSDVTETTREKIRQVLADSNDLPVSDRATYIVDTLDDPDFNRSRALMIARTESTTAANKGASIGNEDSDYETVKQWVAVEDANTRPTHSEADGQQVDSDAMFVVGSSMCRYPGDISLPANEVVNCRCTLAYIPVFENGVVVLKG